MQNEIKKFLLYLQSLESIFCSWNPLYERVLSFCKNGGVQIFLIKREGLAKYGGGGGILKKRSNTYFHTN